MNPPSELSWINDYIGLPFDRDPGNTNAVNCWRLYCLIILDQLGISLDDFSEEYSDAVNIHETSRAIDRHRLELFRLVTEPQCFDAVLMTTGRLPIHVGMYLGFGWIIHCEPGVDSILRHVRQPDIRNRISGYYRLKELM